MRNYSRRRLQHSQVNASRSQRRKKRSLKSNLTRSIRLGKRLFVGLVWLLWPFVVDLYQASVEVMLQNGVFF